MSRWTTRRRFLAGAGSAATVGLAGCTSGTDSGSDGSSTSGSTTTAGGTTSGSESDTLRVGTYSAFVDAPSTSAGPWIKEEFEARHDVTLEWVVRENELNDFIQRRQRGVDLEADMYVGLTPQDLVRADQALDDGSPLFTGFDTSRLAQASNIVDAYRFDPQDRVLPTGASYVCIVYDERKVDPPATFEELTTDEYADSLLLANPDSTATGLLFLLWSINTVGAENYLDYWQRLMDNGVRVLGSWSDAYAAYSNEEAPMVVSYSTDQVYAASADENMARHQIAFPNDQGYAYVDGTAPFATTEKTDLVHTFMDFMLDPEVQQQVAVKNVGLPTVTNASLPEDMQQYAHEPANPVQFGYDTLAANMDTWRDEWARQTASK